MCNRSVAVKRIQWGVCPQVTRRCASTVTRLAARTPLALGAALTAAFAASFATSAVFADPVVPIVPDAPAAPHPVVVPPATLRPSWDLDGTYLWLGPVGAAGYLDATWDSTFGGEAAVVVVHERERLGLVGVDVGASRWTERGGGHVWVDGLLGTHLLGRMWGASLGPIVELSELARPRFGGSVGLWGFAGITPYARVGVVERLGMFAELGIHIALPVLRR
jgi:hypothetical protein